MLLAIIIWNPLPLGKSPQLLLQQSVLIFCGCTAVTSLTSAPWAEETMRVGSYLCFLLLEMSIGIYFPAVGCLRSQLIPEEKRATVTNWFRVPMNAITCLTLLAVNSPTIGYDKRAIFATCTALLITCTVISNRFINVLKKHQPIKKDNWSIRVEKYLKYNCVRIRSLNFRLSLPTSLKKWLTYKSWIYIIQCIQLILEVLLMCVQKLTHRLLRKGKTSLYFWKGFLSGII